jgi:hypothetical protein
MIGKAARVAILSAAILWAQYGAAQELARNGDMEAGKAHTPPDGWVLNAYGELAANVAWDPTVAHTGRASMLLHCAVFRGGAAQAYLPVPAVRKGETYTLRAWMRAEGLSAPVQLQVRDVGVPYHSYLGTTALVTEQWRPVVVIGKADEDGPAVGVFVLFASAGKLWVDDLSLTVGEHPVAPEAAASPPVVKGNVVQNSGFELGMAGWTMPEMVAIEGGGVAGHCAHWLNKSGYMLEGRPVALKPGQRYTFSAYLQSGDPGTRVTMGLYEVGGSDQAGREFSSTPEWQRCSFSFSAQPRCNQRYFLSFSKTAGGSFRVDNVQLEEGDLTDYAPAHPVELAFDLPRNERLPGIGQEVRVGVLCARVARAASPPPMSLVATDYFGRVVRTVAVKTNQPRTEVSLGFDRPGFFSLCLVESAGSGVIHDEAELCATQGIDRSLEGDPFFGAHGTEGHPDEYHAITALAKAGARFWRLHDLPSYTQWFMVEPEKGKWVWHDDQIDAMRARGLRVLGVFCRTPKWAGRDPGGEPVDPMAWPPRDWDEFGEYVYRTVEHYRGKIKHWEVWNEPWGRGFWAGTPEEYAKLLEVAYTQANRADSDCTVIGGCFWPPAADFTDRVLACEAVKYMDAVSYHHYCEPDAVAMGQVRSWYEDIRGKLDAAGGKHLPIWMTEGGCSCPSYYWWMDRRDQARAAAETVAKQLIETKSLGVVAYFYYHAWQEIGSPRMFHWLLTNNWVLLEYDGSPKTVYAAYSGAAHVLTGAKPVGSVEQGRYRAHVFQKGNEVVVALWARDALTQSASLSLDLGTQVRLLDMMGAGRPVVWEGDRSVLQLGSSPVYLVVEGMSGADAIGRIREAAR